ncbi:ROK family protein [Actinotalea sp. M2MS4P-6]|uniref:polyphosphate--glucose phosphotransferase n=1 Tax=Actinotalea sp. M2MS4P-6 TaxID=2983762 RepID=UPI0021E4EFD0|nr:ROK family protein [Actinotalea sp. M2MS4P-6]MCV2394392.1 ROK family protein [Actinotalea sp. M2MS4P-6]
MSSDAPTHVIGIDIGGSSLKGGVIDVGAGALAGPPRSVVTPEPSTPELVATAARELFDLLDGASVGGPVGVAFPGVVRDGRTWTAANVDRSWVGAPAESIFEEALGRPVRLINDADAAGLAEAQVGAGAGFPGSVLVLTFGTGIGSALIHDRHLVPGLELGHLELDGAVAEHRASAYAKRREDLDWPEWSARVDRYLNHVGRLVSPDLVVVGGAISADAEQWLPLLHVDFPVVPARLGNDAGAVGAGLYALTATAPDGQPRTAALAG